ncbi:unnamed protein product [Linum trigynum]|uniref:Uncharacterized protein n=1 Tax=Linum trigynum TaxID=586398 RepID=A0AAV2E0T0_9ROSI
MILSKSSPPKAASSRCSHRSSPPTQNTAVVVVVGPASLPLRCPAGDSAPASVLHCRRLCQLPFSSSFQSTIVDSIADVVEPCP